MATANEICNEALVKIGVDVAADHSMDSNALWRLHTMARLVDVPPSILFEASADYHMTATEVAMRRLEAYRAVCSPPSCLGTCQPQRTRRHVESRIVEPKLLT